MPLRVLQGPQQPSGRATVMRLPMRSASLRAFIAGAALALVGGAAWAALSAPPYQVSQKGRAFQPGELTIRRGETVQIINDDADLLHHAYVESERFSFDSGDQEPGSKADVTFPLSGTFSVLCGIHPKMKLTVHVN
jgi:plastocyanin